MDSFTEQSNVVELDNPPTLVAESEKGKFSSLNPKMSSRMSTESVEDKTAMPVLQPNVSVDSGTRSKSGRIRKPARNFTSDEYVVPKLIKKRIPTSTTTSPNNRVVSVPSKPSPPPVVAAIIIPPPPAPEPSTSTSAEMDTLRTSLEERYPNVCSDDDESPFTYIISVCIKDPDLRNDQMSVEDVHAKVKECSKHWVKGPYRLKEDEARFLNECILKKESSTIPVKDWRIIAEAVKTRMARIHQRFSKAKSRGKPPVAKTKTNDVQKCFMDLGTKLVMGKQLTPNSDDEDTTDSDYVDELDEDYDDLDESSNPSSRMSTRSRDPVLKERTSSKTPSVANDPETDLSLGIDDFGGEDLRDEMFDDLDNELVSEAKRKVNTSTSMVAALHATLEKDGEPDFDPDEYEPPALEKDSPMFSLDDMEETDSSCNFFENIKEPSFDNAETPNGLSDEAFAELEQRAEDDDDDSNSNSKPDQVLFDEDYSENVYLEGGSSRRFGDDKFDVGSLEVEESSGNITMNTSGSGRGDFGSPGATMISTKMALMCALKISEDFLPTSHEKYLDRLEITDKYHHNDLDDIRRKFNMRPSPHVGKRKMKLIENDQNKRQKVSLKVMNGSDKPKALPFLRSAYAKCRKFMEDETTVIEKLGNNKILAAGRVIEIQYEEYLKEADVEIPYDDNINGGMPNLPAPTVSNCHAPSCRLGCICSSISEDMPPRKHCGRPRCFFECTCQNILANNSDDGDIRSRLRPRVSLLNWRAESTEKEKEPMTSYRQMERGTHFIRMRRNVVQPERLRREFVLDGKVVERSATKVAKEKERLRTKALLQSSHRRMMAKPAEGHRYVRVVPAAPKPEYKAKVNVEQLKKKCNPITVDVEHMDVSRSFDANAKPRINIIGPQKKNIITNEYPTVPRMLSKDFEEMKSIIQEMTEDYQLFIIDNKLGFFSWAKGLLHPKVIMYQTSKGDDMIAPWLYLPIPPLGHSWLCHHLTASFEKTDYVYIPEAKCCISSHALKLNMNKAIAQRKAVVFDVKANGNSAGNGKIYFFPDLPRVLVCGPFRTDQTTVDANDSTNAERVVTMLEHFDKPKTNTTTINQDKTWKHFTTTPTIFPIKKRLDREAFLTPDESRRLFEQIYPTVKDSGQTKNPKNGAKILNKPSVPQTPLDWSKAVKFVELGDFIPVMTNKIPPNLTEIITL